MARVHLLAASAVMLGRFWGMSAPFARLGEAVMPVDTSGQPRTQAWEAYARACEEELPLEVRDERWIEAHMRDVARVREAGLEAAFFAEAQAHEEEPLWRLLVQHLEMTLGARLFDQPALHRGQQVGPTDGWPLLAATLGEDAWIREWCASTPTLAPTRCGRRWSCGERPFPARFRTFRRTDGSMRCARGASRPGRPPLPGFSSSHGVSS
jgi:hypothetical protein